MPQRDLIVVGASAGGVQALRAVVAALPADLAATVLVVLHVPAEGGSVLATVLGRDTDLDVAPATDGELLVPGTVRVAPPDRHLVVGDEGGVLRVHLAAGPRVNGHRPAVDPLFRSAARVAGPRVVGLVLSGSLDDGAAGLRRVRARGGVAVVQEPGDALHAGMPAAAVAVAGADHVLPAASIGALLAALTGRGTVGSAPPGGAAPAPPADEPAAVRSAVVEAALWMGLRSLEDRALVADRMARSASGRGNPLTAARFTDQAADSREAVELLRSLLDDTGPTVPHAPGHGGPSSGGRPAGEHPV